MDEKFYRYDLDYFAIIPNEVDGKIVYDIGEFSDNLNSSAPYWTYNLRLPSEEMAKNVCKAMVEAYNDGKNSCDCI